MINEMLLSYWVIPSTILLLFIILLLILLKDHVDPSQIEWETVLIRCFFWPWGLMCIVAATIGACYTLYIENSKESKRNKG